MHPAEGPKYLMAAAQFVLQPEALPVFIDWYRRMFPEECAAPDHVRAALAEGCLRMAEHAMREHLGSAGPSDPAAMLAAIMQQPGLVARGEELLQRARRD